VSKVLANKNLGVVITSTNPTDTEVDKVSNGSVVLWSYPIDTRSSRKVEHPAHIGGITDMVLSADEQYLFTASKDNCLMIWSVKEREQVFTRDNKDTLPWSTELLISAEAKKAQADKLRTLKNDIQESKYENDKKIEVQMLSFNNQLTVLEDNKQLEIDERRNAYNDLVKKKFDQQNNHQKELDKIIGANEKAKSEKENELEAKWQSKKTEIQKLNDEIRKIEMLNNEEMRNKEEKHSNMMNEKLTKHEEIMAGCNEELEKKNQELKELKEYNKQEITEVKDLHTKEFEQ